MQAAIKENCLCFVIVEFGAMSGNLILGLNLAFSFEFVLSSSAFSSAVMYPITHHTYVSSLHRLAIQ
jgi:hypothetical protein